MANLITGDDFSSPQTLRKDGQTFSIDSGATVKVRVVTTDHCDALSEEVVLDNGDVGSDWDNSVVMVNIPSAITSQIEIIGGSMPAIIETQVDDGGKLSWFSNINIIKGHIE